MKALTKILFSWPVVLALLLAGLYLCAHVVHFSNKCKYACFEEGFPEHVYVGVRGTCYCKNWMQAKKLYEGDKP